jgi:acetyl-CoA carboxylase biotin carboxyl carrier protein
MEQARGLSLEALTVRKGDFALNFRASGAAVVEEPFAADAPGLASAAEGPSRTPAAKPAEGPARQKATAAQPAAAEYKNIIKAPLVGTFYLSPGPGKPPFIKVGDTVAKGAKVCIVEAMKLFNEINAPSNIKIVAILAQDGQNVDKEQPLVAWEPA